MENLTENQKETATTFIVITNTSENVAIEFLGNHEWNLENAVNQYYTNGINLNNENQNENENENKLSEIADENDEKETEKNYSSYLSYGYGQKVNENLKPEKIEELFYVYATEMSEYIDSDGLKQFYEDLEIEPGTIMALILAWKFRCTEIGKISKTEFIKGFCFYEIDTIKKLKFKINQFERELYSERSFKQLYNYVFEYAKQDKLEKTLSIHSAFTFWKQLLGNRFILLNDWVRFIKKPENSEQVVSFELWSMLYDFAGSVTLKLKGYDKNVKWPPLILEFIEWFKEGKDMDADEIDENYDSSDSEDIEADETNENIEEKTENNEQNENENENEVELEELIINNSEVEVVENADELD
ncbi:rp42 related [Anaeramoeba flamelloides]|uniref:Defective in cullin neddylation protein n=2 Tax=Anaeramoeba flamelloides TaxID=1746091 RepID=A0AAV7ZN33_9EUKA|nr:rp42 related [Anaeramoeba flamelloides]